MAKETFKMKSDPTVWENIFANDTWDKSLISKKFLYFLKMIIE